MLNLSINNFKPFELKDKVYIQNFVSKAEEFLNCEYVFTNLFTWGKIYDNRWTEYKNSLLFCSVKDNALLMPAGKTFSPEELKEILEAIFPDSDNSAVFHVHEKYIEQNPTLTEFFEINFNRDFADYIYLTEKLYHLKGEKLHKKKNLLSQFRKNNPDAVCIRMEKKHLADCFSLAEKWCVEKTCHLIGITHEQSAMGVAFKHFESLDAEGLVLYAGGKIVAFSYFSRLNSETAVIHFEKYDRDVKGAAQAINWETAKYFLGKYKYINREQDLGIPGLRQAKESYDPEMLLGQNSLKPRKK